MVIDEVLKANEEFVANYEGSPMSHLPQKKLAILTCMDTRLTCFLPEALGIVETQLWARMLSDQLRQLSTPLDARK